MLLKSSPTPGWFSVGRAALWVRLRRFWRWWFQVTANDPVRQVLNRGFVPLITLAFLAQLASAVRYLVNGEYVLSAALAGFLPVYALMWWLNRRGSSLGTGLFAAAVFVITMFLVKPSTYAPPLTVPLSIDVALIVPVAMAVMFVTSRWGWIVLIGQLAVMCLILWFLGYQEARIWRFLYHAGESLGFLVAVMIFFSGAFTRTVRTLIAANTALHETQQQLAHSREIERLHLAQELHDQPIQDIHATRFQIQLIMQRLAGSPLVDSLQHVQQQLQEVTHALRVICGELRPPTLIPFGVGTALRSSLEQIQQAHPDLTIQLDLMDDGQQLPEQTRLAVYRICHEAVMNVIKHAEARVVQIAFHVTGTTIELTITDDGRGFLMPDYWVDLSRRGRLGLLGIHERVTALNGSLQIETALGGGTQITVTLPRSEG